MIGTYSILNTISGKRYIGQSIDIERRIAEHQRLLKKGTHPCDHLQRSFVKHGEQSFEYRVLEECPANALTQCEQYWMDFFRPQKLFNSAPAAGSNAGIKWNEETRGRMSKAKKGKKLSPEHKAKLAASLIGNTHTLGKKLTSEHKEKIRAATRGRIVTDEVRRKIADSLMGHAVSKETREKVSLASIGRQHSEESRAKIGLASKQRYEDGFVARLPNGNFTGIIA